MRAAMLRHGLRLLTEITSGLSCPGRSITITWISGKSMPTVGELTGMWKLTMAVG